MTERIGKLAKIVVRLLCILGFHDFKIIDATLLVSVLREEPPQSNVGVVDRLLRAPIEQIYTAASLLFESHRLLLYQSNMVTDTDVYHSTKLIIDQYGEDAEIQASMRAKWPLSHFISGLNWALSFSQ